QYSSWKNRRIKRDGVISGMNLSICNCLTQAGASADGRITRPVVFIGDRRHHQRFDVLKLKSSDVHRTTADSGKAGSPLVGAQWSVIRSLGQGIAARISRRTAGQQSMGLCKPA